MIAFITRHWHVVLAVLAALIAATVAFAAPPDKNEPAPKDVAFIPLPPVQYEPAVAGLPPTGRLAPVDVNRATRSELEAVPGIGPARAARILATRSALGGAFLRLRDLRRVKGIGRKTLQRLRPYLTLNKQESQKQQRH